MAASSEFRRDRHVKFFQRCLQILPARYASLDTSRMTIAFFAISGLDVLNALDAIDGEKANIIEWIYAFQVLPDASGSNLRQCGFRGSATLGASFDPEKARLSPVLFDSGHIAMTYTALLSLVILGDDLSRVNRRAVITGLRQLQLADGSFCPTPDGSENDMRFIFCASCISYVLDDWTGMDVELTLDYIRRSFTYEGAFAQGPGLEAHGGSTFCAVASLVLMGRLHSTLSTQQMRAVRRWCLFRQQTGFQGRPNKPVDTCYSFWVGATLQMLDAFKFVDCDANHSFLMDTQDQIVGGFSKWPDHTPDALHAYFGVCALSLMNERGLQTMCSALSVSRRAADKLAEIHGSWSSLRRTPQPDFCRDKHVSFLRRSVAALRERTSDGDCCRRLMEACYSLSGLDMLNSLHVISSERQSLVERIYSLQGNMAASRETQCSTLQDSASVTSSCSNCVMLPAAGGRCLAVLCSSLCGLLVLGDDLSHVDRAAVSQALCSLHQLTDRCTSSRPLDMVSVYYSVCIAYILQDFSDINVDHLSAFIKSCLCCEGGCGYAPGLEADVVATYCVIASLVLLRRLRSVLTVTDIQLVGDWCISQLGRDPRLDCCSAFCIMAVLTVLGDASLHQAAVQTLRTSLLSTQSKDTGGFVPTTGGLPDAMATYYAVCALSLGKEHGTRPVSVALGISDAAARRLYETHGRWLHDPLSRLQLDHDDDD